MRLVNRLAAAALAMLLPAVASAQQSVGFRADPQFTREHVFTLKDSQAEIISAGGVH